MNKKKILKRIKYALRFLPDWLYIQLYYFGAFRKFCNLKNPQTYNEKLNWLKLHDHNPLYTQLVDKIHSALCENAFTDIRANTCTAA